MPADNSTSVVAFTEPKVVSVTVPRTDLRTPLAVVIVAVGPLVLSLGVSRLTGKKLLVRPPTAASGGPGVGASPEVWAAIEAAAIAGVTADPAAKAYLLGPRAPRAPEHA
jgi:hypothetical protein